MLLTFRGPGEIVNAFEAGLPQPDPELSPALVAVDRFLHDAAVDEIYHAAQLEDVNERTRRYHEVLYNAAPRLEDAEALIPQWAASSPLVPPSFVAHPKQEFTVKLKPDGMGAHVDIYSPNNGFHPADTAPTGYAFGPFATSIGARGLALFEALRLPVLTREELLLGSQARMAIMLTQLIDPATKRLRVASATAVQQRGTLMLIPGAPQPAAHGIGAAVGTDRVGVTSGYLMTNGPVASFDTLRTEDLARRMRLERMMLPK